MTERLSLALGMLAALLAAGCAGDDPVSGTDDTDPVVDGDSPWVDVLFLNELMAVNNGTVADEGGQFDDWFELYNAGDDPVDLTGFQVTDDLDGKEPDVLESGDVPAGGYRLLWADGESLQGPLHLSFKLSGSGESIALLDPEGRIVDTVFFGPQTADVSWGRTVDGGETWAALDVATPGGSNDPE